MGKRERKGLSSRMIQSILEQEKRRIGGERVRQVLCSTGALIGRPNGRDYRLLSGCAENLRCDGYEFMMYDSWYGEADALARFLKELSLPIPVMHCEKSIGEGVSAGPGEAWDRAVERFEINCQMAVFLGADRLVMHLWNGTPSDTRFENNLTAYPVFRETARKHGLDLLIENVVCAQSDPLTRWKELLKLDLNAHFVLDTKMAAFHKQLDSLYAPENRFLWTDGHIRHLHVNDYGGGYMDWKRLGTLHPGQGIVDFDKLFAFLSALPYQGDYTVEATSFLLDGIIHWQDLNRTFALIRALDR